MKPSPAMVDALRRSGGWRTGKRGEQAEQVAAADRAAMTAFQDMTPSAAARLLSFGVRRRDFRMVNAFNIEPFVGALPVRFGMHRTDVHHLLGPPEASHAIWDQSGTTDYWNESRINVGYDNDGIVKHVGFCPGGCELLLRGNLLWSLQDQPDPNPQLLQLDPTPLESVGILIYPVLGISTSGYHDGDEAQLALTVSPAGTWDDVVEAGRPDLSRYRLQ